MSYRFEPIRRGDDWGPYDVTIVLNEGALTDCKVWFGVKRKLTDADDASTSVVINSDDDAGVEIVSGTVVRVSLTNAQTLTLYATRNYVALQILTPDGKLIEKLGDFDERVIVTDQIIQATA